MEYQIQVSNPAQRKAVYQRLFDLGFSCNQYTSFSEFMRVFPKSLNNGDGWDFVCFDTEKKKFDVYANNQPNYQLITLGDFFSSLIENKEVIVLLNRDYTAKVSKNGVVVGCQTFPLDAILKLKAAYDVVTG